MLYLKPAACLTLTSLVFAFAMPVESAQLATGPTATPSSSPSLQTLQPITKLPAKGFARKPKKTTAGVAPITATATPTPTPLATQTPTALPESTTLAVPAQSVNTEPAVSVNPPDLRQPLEYFYPILKTYHALSLDIASHACRSLDMAEIDLSTEKCGDLNQAFHNLSLQWSDLLEQFNVLGGGPALETLANDWRAYTGSMRVQYGDRPFAAPTVP